MVHSNRSAGVTPNDKSLRVQFEALIKAFK